MYKLNWIRRESFLVTMLYVFTIDISKARFRKKFIKHFIFCKLDNKTTAWNFNADHKHNFEELLRVISQFIHLTLFVYIHTQFFGDIVVF